MIHEKKIDKLYFIKITNFYMVKDTIKRMKIQATYWEKILAKRTSKIYKVLKLNNKKSKSQFKTGHKI